MWCREKLATTGSLLPETPHLPVLMLMFNTTYFGSFVVMHNFCPIYGSFVVVITPPPPRQRHRQCMTCSQSCSDSQSKMSRQRLSGFFVTATVKQTPGECHLPLLHAATCDTFHWPPLVWMHGIIYHLQRPYLASFPLTCSGCDTVSPQTEDCTAHYIQLHTTIYLVSLVSIYTRRTSSSNVYNNFTFFQFKMSILCPDQRSPSEKEQWVFPKLSAKASCCLLNSNWLDSHASIISVHWTVTSLPF